MSHRQRTSTEAQDKSSSATDQSDMSAAARQYYEAASIGGFIGNSNSNDAAPDLGARG